MQLPVAVRGSQPFVQLQSSLKIISLVCCFPFQLSPERGFLPVASQKHDPWGEGLKNHPKEWIRKRYELLTINRKFFMKNVIRNIIMQSLFIVSLNRV